MRYINLQRFTYLLTYGQTDRRARSVMWLIETAA